MAYRQRQNMMQKNIKKYSNRLGDQEPYNYNALGDMVEGGISDELRNVLYDLAKVMAPKGSSNKINGAVESVEQRIDERNIIEPGEVLNQMHIVVSTGTPYKIPTSLMNRLEKVMNRRVSQYNKFYQGEGGCKDCPYCGREAMGGSLSYKGGVKPKKEKKKRGPTVWNNYMSVKLKEGYAFNEISAMYRKEKNKSSCEPLNSDMEYL